MIQIELGKTSEKIPILGQGTWGIKSNKNKHYYDKWKESLGRGIELGLSHIDTAEFYGFDTSEKIVGEVISENRRDDLFITTKLYPMHLRYNKMIKGANKSLKRLGLKTVDLYLIHFPNKLVPIKTHMKLLETLLNKGKTRYIGVSNFSIKQFREAQETLKKAELTCNQLKANLVKQTHIHESLPYYQENRVTLTAYSPLGHRGFQNLKGEMLENLEKIAYAHSATIQQIAIAWLINHKNVITIPKAFQVKHVESNWEATNIKLSQNELDLLSKK